VAPGIVADVDEARLLADLRDLIKAARQRVATVANSTHTLLCWHVGRRLLRENLLGGRAAYGKRILATVSQELTAEYGEGFTLRSLYRFIQFSQLFPDEGIVSTLSTQLSWSHFMEIFPIRDPLARDFYAEMCRIERWDVRTFRQKIGGMLYERTALSKNTKAVISSEIANLRDGRMTPDVVFRVVEKGQEFDALTAEAQRAIDLLQERRTALISAAVTGKIDVRGLAESEAA